MLSVSLIIWFVYAGLDLHRTYLWTIAGTPTTVWRLGAVQAFIFPFVDSPTPRIGESGSRRLPVSVSRGVSYWIFKGGTCCPWGTWKMKSSGQHNLHNSDQHRSLTLAFKLFQFCLRICGDIRHQKSTPRLGESESCRFPISVSRGVANSPHRRVGSHRLPV